MGLFKKVVAGLVFCIGVLAQPAFAQKYVCMQSTQGEWCFEMLTQTAPGTVANFLRYVTSGAYADSIVHRSVADFVIQGGGFSWRADAGLDFVTNYGQITNEFGRSNLRGTVAMARVGGQPNSASNQWFVNVADNTGLNLVDGGFTVFAQVAYGMDVIDKISRLRLVDLSSVHAAFSSFPTTATTNIIDRPDAVIITRAYTTDVLPGTQTVLPYHCTPDVAAAAVAEFCANAITIPVSIQGVAYEATLELVSAQPMTFALKGGSLKTLTALPATFATYNAAAKELTIPTVRVGATLFDNVVLKFAGAPSQQFTLATFSKR